MRINNTYALVAALGLLLVISLAGVHLQAQIESTRDGHPFRESH